MSHSRTTCSPFSPFRSPARFALWGASLVILLGPGGALSLAQTKSATSSAASADAVSYYKQVRPIFQAKCQGCHQPAKPNGKYVMTVFDRMLAGGESKEKAIVAGKPAESYLIEQITPVGGKAAMPQDKPPLSAAEIDLVTRWISQGANDDTPASALARYDMEHPPSYSRPPVIASLDASPDGKLLAVSGYHEVLLWKADGSELVARLVGLSERIESVKFSPDGSKLVVTGGLPARMGEVQIWDVAKRKLILSVPVTYDTVFGASWSPDGSKIAFGCTDNTVRAIDAKTGEQVLFMGSHSDWALDTVFTKDGSNLISVGRDMTTKLTEVATQRFVDNVSSITPGALKGGIAAVARHPQRDEVIIGGSDGIPKLYRVFRLTSRVIGDDSNLIREFPAMPGRVYNVAVSNDGKRIAAASSLDGAGQVNVYSYEFNTDLPDNLKAIMSKVSTTRSAQENETLAKYFKDGVKLIASTPMPKGGVYALAFLPDGKSVAAAGGDGTVRLLETETGKLIKEWIPAPIQGGGSLMAAKGVAVPPMPDETPETEMLPKGAVVSAIEIQPREIRLAGRFAYAQLLATAALASGDRVDVTRMVAHKLSSNIAEVSKTGLVRPRSDGKGTLTLTIGGKSAEVPVTVLGLDSPVQVDYVHDVMPVLSRLGCNQGTCHGAAAGKNGFKLSLRGYDPLFDVRALTDDHGARRINLASAEESMMLLKPTAAVPHVGGPVTQPGEAYYEILRAWIADGAKLDQSTPRVKKIEVAPLNPVIQRIGTKQQMRVLATYANGEVRDVTREAFIDSGNSEVAIASKTGLMTSVRRGEAPILARFEGSYAATTLTVMGDRDGFVWTEPPAYGKLDELAAAKWKRMKIQPSEVCTDTDFIRRVTLDLTGLPPTADQVRAFLADARPSRAKREAMVDQLVGGKDYIEFWTNKWADMLQVNRKFLGVEGATALRAWIRDAVAKNTPYDQFSRTILVATGSNKDNPPASYFKVLREAAPMMENTTQLFLAIRFNCNKCHDHPFERWTQDQYYQTAAYFSQVELKEDPASTNRRIGGSAVEGSTPLFELVSDTGKAEMIHDRTKKQTAPKFPFECKAEIPDNATRRQALAAWMTSPDNPYFAKSYVNRLWGYLFGVGIIEPLDDIRAGNPASNPDLLDALTTEFIKSGFNVQHIIKLICKSRTYQLSVATNRWNNDDKINFSHATARRLPAEVLYDTIYRVTGAQSKIPGVAPGTRAAELPDSEIDLPSGFFTTFGRPARESSCECERSSGLQLGPVMALVSGPTLADAIADPDSELTRLVGRMSDDKALLNEIFLRILNRQATESELASCLGSFQEIDQDHQRLARELGQRATEVALMRPALERQREANLTQAETALAAYEKDYAPKRAAAEKQKADQTAKLEAELVAYEATLPAKISEWEKKQSTAVRWIPLDPKSMTSNNGTTLTKAPDLSIRVEGKSPKRVVTIVAETEFTDITGLRLEVLPDDKLPSKGPGQAADGNFVLTEIELSAAPKSDPKQVKPIKLVTPLADFSQQEFDISEAVDGNPNDLSNGWAVSPATGTVHWATFETAEPVGKAGGSLLTIKLHHKFAQMYTLGRFRLSVTRLAKPLGLGLPDDFRAIVATVPELRTEAQKSMLLGYFKAVDTGFRDKLNAVNASKAALPEDAQLATLKKVVESARKPLPTDARLTQIQNDLDMSVKQSVARRLTVAQDVAWALINSPAFLFNH